MKKLLIILSIASLSAFDSAAQIYNVDNCNTVTSYLVSQGDTLAIRCDSVYLLNKKTFSIYKIAYERWKGRDVNIRQAFDTYESMIQLQDNRIGEQDLEYNRLKMQFDSLVITSGKFMDNTGNRLGELTEMMNKVNANLNGALTQIHETEALIKTEQKKQVRNSLTWGVGGFTLGLLICLLIK